MLNLRFNRLAAISLKVKAKMIKRTNNRLLYTLFALGIVAVGTYFAIQYAKGSYRFSDQGIVVASGLLSANSFPTGAEVLINGKLKTATDDTLYLEPGEYQVEIRTDGFSPWKKTLQIEAQLVTQTNATLFRSAPSLTPLTFTGIKNVLPSPDGLKIVFYVDSANQTTKNGLYLMTLDNNFLSLQKSPKQLTEDDLQFDLSQAKYIWSPDSTELIVIGKKKEVLIQTDRKQILASLPDISQEKQALLSLWEEEMYLRERQFLSEFPDEIINIATTSAKNVYLSPDKKRLMYTALAELQLSDDIVPPLPASNTQPETRSISPGNVYIYDREEDKNFLIAAESTSSSTLVAGKKLLANDLHSEKVRELASSPSAFRTLQATSSAQTADNFNRYHTSLFIDTLQWYPDSKHVLFADQTGVQIMEYDGTNKTTVYSGPSENNFIYPWPDGNKLLILAAFSPDTPSNLYAIELR